MSESENKKLLQTLLTCHYRSGVGHLGGNLSCVTALSELFGLFHPERHRIVVSKGHAAGALYVALSQAGIIDSAELSTFHRDGTLLPGHPPANKRKSIPFATGSLGHGLSLSAGFALSETLRGGSQRVFCLTSDGEWQEGSTWEALVFACHHHLDNLTILIDHNGLQGFGSTNQVASMDPLWERVSGFPVVSIVVNGHDRSAIREALMRQVVGIRLIFLKTIKGFGIEGMEGKMESHYLPLTDEQYRKAMAALEVLS